MLGAWARYRVAGYVYQRADAAFPWGTLAVNVGGSFVLGLLLPMLDLAMAGAAEPLTPLRGFVTVGVLGSLTTFSTFAYETVRLYEEGRGGRAALYVCASLILGLVSIAMGLLLGSALA